MVIEVNYENNTRDGFGSRPYSYFCTIPDIKVGDLVKAPTGRGEALARVAVVDIPEYRIPSNILGMMKTVSERADPQEAPVTAPPPEQLGLDDLMEPEAAAEAEPISFAISPDVFRVEQLPVISEHLRSVKERVEIETTEAASMVCTEETIQAVKAKRAELNKTFTELDARRKEVKAAVMDPYEQFEAVFRECITEPFKAADAALKDKVAEVEAVQRDTCEERLRLYFDELCQLHGVDYIRYEQAGIKIDMASAKAKTPKKLMDKLGEFVSGVAVGADQIRQMDDAAEIMAEYKTCLNVGKAVSVVQERRRRVEQEKKNAEVREQARKRQEEAVAKVDAIAPPVTVPPPAEDPVIPRLSFTVIGARKSQLIKLREYLKTEGMIYE